MHAQIGRLDASGRPHRSGDEHLPTVAGGLDVCGSVDHRPEVVAAALLGFTEVQTHADLQGWAGPGRVRKRTLRFGGRPDRVRWSAERRSERITRRREDVSPVAFDGASKDGVVDE